MIALTENVGHLILEILRSDQRVQKLLSTLNHGVNLTTASSKMRIVVEGLPKIVD